MPATFHTFKVYSPNYPPPGVIRGSSLQHHRPLSRRLEIPGYRQRLTTLYYETVLTQSEIIETLNQEFEDRSVSISGLKRDLNNLGLRRYNRRKNSPDEAGTRDASGAQHTTASDPNTSSSQATPRSDVTLQDNIVAAEAVSPYQVHGFSFPCPLFSDSGFETVEAYETVLEPSSFPQELLPNPLEADDFTEPVDFDDFFAEDAPWDSGPSGDLDFILEDSFPIVF